MHLIFREIAAGRAYLDEIIVPPPESWAVNQPRRSSLMFLGYGQQLTLEELIMGLAVPSGNDAAVAAALRFAPSVEDFAEMMNREAQAIGLTKTRFVEPSGISYSNMTTAREFARFCRFYIEAYPESLRDYHSVREFAYPREENVAEQYRENPGTRVQRNRNGLLGRVEGVDGLKTGYIDEAGYNIALTAERNNSRFIAIILGAPAEWGGDRIRDEDGRKLLNWVFDHYKTIRLNIEEPEPVRVWKGKENDVGLVFGAPLEFTALAERGENLSRKIEIDEPLIAPIPANSQVGSYIIYDSFGELRNIPLLAANGVERGGFFKRLFDSIKLFFRRA
jgi:D-alanyl-D-alanine carboxypeptidase (penicillin-binding protein 5/6)